MVPYNAAFSGKTVDDVGQLVPQTRGYLPGRGCRTAGGRQRRRRRLLCRRPAELSHVVRHQFR